MNKGNRINKDGLLNYHADLSNKEEDEQQTMDKWARWEKGEIRNQEPQGGWSASKPPKNAYIGDETPDENDYYEENGFEPREFEEDEEINQNSQYYGDLLKQALASKLAEKQSATKEKKIKPQLPPKPSGNPQFNNNENNKSIPPLPNSTHKTSEPPKRPPPLKVQHKDGGSPERPPLPTIQGKDKKPPERPPLPKIQVKDKKPPERPPPMNIQDRDERSPQRPPRNRKRNPEGAHNAQEGRHGASSANKTSPTNKISWLERLKNIRNAMGKGLKR